MSLPSDFLMAFPNDLHKLLLRTLFNICQSSVVLLSFADKYHSRQVSHFIIANEIKLERIILCHELAANGYTNVLEWTQTFFTNKVIDGETKQIYEYEINHDVCMAAVRCGQLETLKWLDERDHIYWTDKIVKEAIRYDHFEITKWSMENICASLVHVSIILDAVINGNVKIFEFIWSCFSQTKIDHNMWGIMALVGQFGHVEILEWIQSKLLFDSHSHSTLLEWYRKIYMNATLYGKIEILKRLKQNNEYWNLLKSVIPRHALSSYAIPAPKNCVLMWSSHNDCPINIEDLNLAKQMYAEIKEHKSYCPICDDVVDNINVLGNICGKCGGTILTDFQYKLTDKIIRILPKN
jgi:hypothetical protein